MLALFNVPVVIAYHLVSALAGGLAVPLGGMAAAAAIIVFTMAVRLLVTPLSYYAMRGQHAQARLAPEVAELRRRYARQPERMQREITALYRTEGTGVFSGCLPVLVQAPFLSVMYLLFRSPGIGGAANHLLTGHVFGAALGSHWLSGAGPLSGQGIVFLGIFALLAVIGWLQSRSARRLAAGVTAPAAGPPAGAPPPGNTARSGNARSKAAASSAKAASSGKAAPPGEAARLAGATPPGAAFGVLTRMAPYLSVVAAAFVPLAACLCLVTSAAWTVAERAVLRRKLLFA